MKAYDISVHLARGGALRTLVFLSALSTISCANTTGFLVTGGALEEYDNAVQAIHKKMGAKLKTGEVSPAEYDAWGAFVRKSQDIYPQAGRAWQLGLAANDSITTGKAWEDLLPLAAEVAKWAVKVGYTYRGWTASPSGAGPAGGSKP